MSQEFLLFCTSIALFLFAMVGLNTRMQRLLSVRVREYIKYSVRRPIYGLLTGIFGTIAFQSSSAKASRKLFAFSAVVDNIERIGDRALNLAGLARYKHESKADISSEAEAELDGISRMLFENLRDTWTVLEKGDRVFIENIVDRDERIDVKVQDALQNHLMRFREGRCKAEAGPIFVDMLINFERISGHCKHIGLNFEHLESLSAGRKTEG